MLIKKLQQIICPQILQKITASENKILNDSKNSLDKDDLLKNAESFFQKNENN